ncbi:MAG: CRISPR-associated protein Cas4 [Lachnospiraceae bacterium]|nr:CRISPR-associated protein Cas4 [Lachnospiraceae bacterium]
MLNIEITIRSIQHYLYCPHRWGLIEIDRAWAENMFVTKANLIHRRVHNPDNNYTIRGKKVFTSVHVYNDNYNLYGVVDCIEGTESEDGVYVHGSDKKYHLCIVEYKPTKPKNKEYNYDDLMQVFAQKICVDYVFECDCDAVLYYADIKKRIKLPLRENYFEYDRALKKLIEDMSDRLKNGIIPPINKSQNCNGCSMKDLCMPSYKTVMSLRKSIEKIKEEEL